MQILRHHATQCLAVAVALIILNFTAPSARAQSCRPTMLYYLVRDEKGKPVPPADKNISYQTKAKYTGWWDEGYEDVLNSAEMPKDVTGLNGKILKLYTGDGAACFFQKPVTLQIELNGKKMELIFKPLQDLKAKSADYVVDSLPFQEGTFEIDLTFRKQWPPQFYPATGWQKMK
ncbi:MAG TPA: hypothetical protein VE961_07545 [Pyrinomonadaceae bacterium]|nr:hypothetical protein [Pyrinomonadaceae bacterium]